MSEKMTEDRWSRYEHKWSWDGGEREEIRKELSRARASEDAKDKEIERLKADNAVLLADLQRMHEVAQDVLRFEERERIRIEIIDRMDKPHPGAALLEELTRLRAQVAELQRNRDSADADFATLSYALATRGAPLPECRSAGGIVIASTVRDLRDQVATLIQGQQRNGEARQRAILDFACELAEMPPEKRDTAIRRIIDRSENKP